MRWVGRFLLGLRGRWIDEQTFWKQVSEREKWICCRRKKTSALRERSNCKSLAFSSRRFRTVSSRLAERSKSKFDCLVHGNQSNITPNFNTIVQTNSQPFVQNNTNTLVQNNTNVIQPINLVNFNNVNIDSLQTFLAAQNNLVYFSQPSSSTTTTTTVTTTTTTNLNLNNESDQHQISIRPKPSILTPFQDSNKVKSEHYDYPARQLSTPSNSETTNLLDNDLNHKQPRPIRPKPSSRSNSLQVIQPQSVLVFSEERLSL